MYTSTLIWYKMLSDFSQTGCAETKTVGPFRVFAIEGWKTQKTSTCTLSEYCITFNS